MGAELELRWVDVPDAELKPGRRFLDFVVDGASLFERLGGDDDISCLGWLPERWDDLAARRLLGRAEPDVEDRVAIWVCCVCGDVLCGALTARVEMGGDVVVWRDFALSYPEHAAGIWVHEVGPFAGWEPIRFRAAGYVDAIERRPRSSHQAVEKKRARLLRRR